MGTIRLRGSTFWARWMYKGKTFERSTGISIGVNKAIEKATRKMEEFTAPYRTMDELDLQTFFSMKIKTLGQIALEANVKANGITLGKAFDAFMKSPRRREVKISSVNKYRRILDRISEYFGKNTLMSDITPSAAEAYAVELGEGVANGTFNNYIANIRHVWEVLSAQSGCKVNPWREIQKKKDDGIRKAPITQSNIQMIKDYAESKGQKDIRLLVTIGEHTGMRIGDCAHLRWEDIDISNGFIRVTTIKTGAKISIPILKGLRTELEAIPEDRRTGYVIPSLIHKSGDEFYTVKKCLDALNPIFKMCGAEFTSNNSGSRRHSSMTFHGLRAAFVTTCAEAGIPLEIVKSVVGHSTISMTEHYTHIREKAVKDAFDKAGIK